MERSRGWVSWSGTVRATGTVVRPPDEDAVAAVVADAAAAGREVRAAGAGHSFSPLVATDGVIVDTAALSGVIDVDREAGTATVWAGTRIADLGAPLAAAGVALANQGDIDRQAIAGAVATGTHGTGPTLGSLSTFVAGARIVDPAGRLVDIGPPDERFEVVRLSLGAAGILTRLTLRVVPAYRLHERTWREDTEVCLARLDERIAATRHYEFWWFPHRDRCESKSLEITDAPPDPLEDRPWERIDESWKVFPSVRDVPFREMEYAVPAEAGPACFAEIRRLWLDRHPEVLWPVEYRTVAADDIWLSPAHGRPTVTISVHQGVDEPWEGAFRDAEAVFVAHGGRPHWGKIHWRTGGALADDYPRWHDWWRVRDAMDPAEVFCNAHLRELRGS